MEHPWDKTQRSCFLARHIAPGPTSWQGAKTRRKRTHCVGSGPDSSGVNWLGRESPPGARRLFHPEVSTTGLPVFPGRSWAQLPQVLTVASRVLGKMPATKPSGLVVQERLTEQNTGNPFVTKGCYP